MDHRLDYFPAQLFFWVPQCAHSLHFGQPQLFSCAAAHELAAAPQDEPVDALTSPWAYGHRRAHPVRSARVMSITAMIEVIRI